MEGIFDAFSSLEITEELPWESAVVAWRDIQIEKKVEDLANSSKKIGIRKYTDELRQVRRSLTNFKNPYQKTAKSRFNMVSLAIRIVTNRTYPEIRTRFARNYYEPYIKTIGELISVLRSGQFINIFSDSNSLKVVGDSGKPEVIFPEPRRIYLSNRGRKSI